MIIDSHCHLDYPNLYDQLDNVIKRAEQKKIPIEFHHVKSHIGIEHNERADKNASLGGQGHTKHWPTVNTETKGPGWQRLELHESERIQKNWPFLSHSLNFPAIL